MSKVIPISHDQPATQRSPEEAIRELHDCLAATNTSMQALAKMFPGATLLTGIIRGEPCITVAFTTSREADHFSRCCLNATESLARVMVSMLPDLQDIFALELKCAKELRQLEHDVKVAGDAAVRAVRAEKK